MTDHDDIDIEDELAGDSRLTEADQEVLSQRAAARGPRDSAGYQRTGAPAMYGNADIVTRTACRHCKAIVEVTDTGLSAFKDLNRWCAATGQRPVAPNEVFLCLACRDLVRGEAARRGSQIVHRLRDCVRVLRDGGTKEEEREATLYLEKNDNERDKATGGSATVRYWVEKRAQKRSSKADY